MGGKQSRDKGKRGEREVVKLLQPIVDIAYRDKGLEPPVLERNLMQSHKGGCDLVGLDWLALEVKFQENTQLKTWWEQTKSQSKGREPVLIHRKSRQEWRVRMFGHLLIGSRRVKTPVDISLQAFSLYFKIRIEEELSDEQ